MNEVIILLIYLPIYAVAWMLLTQCILISHDLKPTRYIWFSPHHWVHQADGWTKQEQEDMRDYLMLTRLNKQ